MFSDQSLIKMKNETVLMYNLGIFIYFIIIIFQILLQTLLDLPATN